jgi:hypothetical protein
VTLSPQSSFAALQIAIEEACSIKKQNQILSTLPNFTPALSPDASATLQSLGIKHGDMLHLKETEIEPEFQLFAQAEPETSPKQKKGKKRASVFTSEGSDADEVARTFLCAEDIAEATRGKSKLGYAAHCQFTAAARMAAAERGSVELNRKQVGKSGDKFKLLVEFKKSARVKPVPEEVPCYSKDEVVAVFSSILRKQTTSKRRKASTHMLNEVEIAMRSPPLYWSIYSYKVEADGEERGEEEKPAAKTCSMESVIEQLMKEASSETAGAQEPAEALLSLP